MSRIQPVFSGLKAKSRKALIPFITAGYPEPTATVPLMHALVRGGADIIELGVPFSDPMADGPVIQRASEIALKHGINLHDIFRCVRQFRETDPHTPVVLMGYANPVERMGLEVFVREAAQAGVDGALIVDYPPEECEAFAALMKAHDMDVIFLLAPTSTEARMEKIGKIASGYVYYVSLKGVTGSASLNADEVAAAIPVIKKHVSIPVGVGFGIRDGETARAVGALADGVVIGSRLIQVLENAEKGRETSDLEAFVGAIRKALDK
ncbi:MAG: tryptophan synthase subunit alpha [Burkholderiaceae bacterium]|jgi:tryptophan synthase alpha chain|nr:tryptophan synthase subunit alpha [Burkholderiaceae bacterium]